MSELYSDLPQDLSAKFKTVGVQTEDNKSPVEALQDVLTGLSGESPETASQQASSPSI